VEKRDRIDPAPQQTRVTAGTDPPRADAPAAIRAKAEGQPS
jgi:hypothetical protein